MSQQLELRVVEASSNTSSAPKVLTDDPWAWESQNTAGGEWILFDAEEPVAVERVDLQHDSYGSAMFQAKDCTLLGAPSEKGPWTEALAFSAGKTTEWQSFQSVSGSGQFWKLCFKNKHADPDGNYQIVLKGVHLFGSAVAGNAEGSGDAKARRLRRKAGHYKYEQMQHGVAGLQSRGVRRSLHTAQVNDDLAGMPLLDMSGLVPLPFFASSMVKRTRTAIPTCSRRAGRRELFCARAAPEPCKDPLRARANLSRDGALVAPPGVAPGEAGGGPFGAPAAGPKSPSQGGATSIFGVPADNAKTPAADAKVTATSIFGAPAADAKAPATSIFGAIGAASGSQPGASASSQNIFGASASGAKAPTQSLFGAVAADPKAAQGLFGPALGQPSGQPSIFAQAPAQPKRGNARRRGR